MVNYCSALAFKVSAFTSRGLSSAGITSNTPEDVAEGVVPGKYRLLFFTPETILNSRKWRHFIRDGRSVLTD